MPPRRSASAKPGSSAAGSATGRARRSGLRALGDDPPVAPRRLDRDAHGFSSRLRRGLMPPAPMHDADSRPRRWADGRSAPATRIACSELRSWMRRTSAPSRTASATAATVPHSRSPGGQPLLPGAGEDGADEVLARERDVERQPQRAQLAEPPQDLQVLLGAEVEVESGVDRDLLLGDAKLPGQLDSPLEPGLEVVDDVVVLAPGPVDPRRPLDVHQHVAAAARRRPARTSPPSRRRCR